MKYIYRKEGNWWQNFTKEYDEQSLSWLEFCRQNLPPNAKLEIKDDVL